MDSRTSAGGAGTKRAAGEGPNGPATIVLEADEALKVALQLHQGGSLPQAEMLYRRILQSQPDNLNALHFLGLLCHQQNRRSEAADLIGRIVALDPQNADAHNNLGNVLEGLGKLSGAEACYRKAISLRPDHASAHNNLGVVLMAQQRAAEAVAAYRRAIALAPDAADFRYNLGNALRKSGELDAAAPAYRKAVELKPEHAGAWQGLARTLTQAGRREEAAAVFEEWLAADPGNPVVRFLRAAFLGQDLPERAPDAYVQQVFDEMAEGYDAHLLENLDYRAHQLLMDAIAGVLPPPAATLDILDAGCGTGLCGPLLRPYARHLTGVDLAPAMLAKAAGRKVYDELINAELTAFLGRSPGTYDLICSADTLCYFGELETVFSAAANALKPGGFLAFTLEDGGGDSLRWQLNPHGRYAHARSYVEDALETVGFAGHSILPVLLRSEGKHPVKGHSVVASRKNGFEPSTTGRRL
jgi:predicted TPR repeat methyltransferase